MNFDRCLPIILKNEGGFVDDPQDPGGMTNYGITWRTLSDWLMRPATANDIRFMTPETAGRIYKVKYWAPIKGDELPAGVDLCVFDFAANAGVGRSAMMLQKIVGVDADGIIGPNTLKAISAANADDLIDRFGDARANYYRSLPEFAHFGHGWLNRTTFVTGEAHKMATDTHE